MAKFVVAPCVEDELFAIWTFIAQDNPDAATSVIESAFETFKSLAERPGLGKLRKFSNPDLKDVRSWHISGFNNYVIFYRPVREGIHVLRVYHGARDIDPLFRET